MLCFSSPTLSAAPLPIKASGDNTQSAVQGQGWLAPGFRDSSDIARDRPAAVHCVQQRLSRDREYVGILVGHHPDGARGSRQHLLQHHELPGRHQFEPDLALASRNRITASWPATMKKASGAGAPTVSSKSPRR